MNRTGFAIALSASVLAWALPAHAQLGSLGKAIGKAQQVRQAEQDLTFSDQEEDELGSDISAKLRERYGVVQDRAVHKYVTLVGTLLAQASSRPTLHWTFIVLDTDGINAFAAPGGYVHITRGALALLQNEAELADVLAHEISHVTAKHTIRAIQKSKIIGAGAQMTRREVLNQAADRGYDILFQNGFDRSDEMEADALGVALANKVGYAPTGLSAFLTRLADRDKGLKERSGLFASHPETQARVDAINKLIASKKLDAAAVVAPRFHQNVTFPPTPVAAVTPTAGGAAPASASSSGSSSGSGKLGLGGLSALASNDSSNQTISSAGSRGVNPDRDAKGGPKKTLVPVTVTSAELAEFRRGITA